MKCRDSIFALGNVPDANLMKRHDRVPAVGCLAIELSYRDDRCASVLVMPARLRDAISGILAGGIPGFGTTTFLLGTSRSSCLVLALCCCFKDDLLRTGHTSCLVITSHCRHWTYHSNCDFLFFVFGVACFGLVGVFLFVWSVAGSFPVMEWYHQYMHNEPGSLSQYRLHLQ